MRGRASTASFGENTVAELRRLSGCHALLTGASGGIGLATTAAFLAQGARCTAVDLSPVPSPALAALLTEHPDDAQYLPCDVARVDRLPALIEEAAQCFGPIRTLFNNAGIVDFAPLFESDVAMYERLYDVNVKGMFFVMQAVLGQMVEHGIAGSVVNLSSQAGRRGEALLTHYCATKAAVISYTQSAARAMAPHGIRINAISPGVIDTPMWDQVDALFARYEGLAIGEKKASVGKAVPLGRMGVPGDVAGAAVFLASTESAYITGQTINVDGGNVMS